MLIRKDGGTTLEAYAPMLATSVRPRPGAPVSTPLRWDEVRSGLEPLQFTFGEVRSRVARDGDPFAPVLGSRQSLGAALRSLG